MQMVSIARAFPCAGGARAVFSTRRLSGKENRLKILCVVPTLICAMATSAVQVSSASTATADALPPPPSNMLVQVATQESSAQDSNARASASGTWLMTWTNKKGEIRHATLHIQQEGETLSGMANVQGSPIKGTLSLTGNVRGNQIVLSVKVYWHHASFTGTVEGSKMSGSTHDGKPWLAARE